MSVTKAWGNASLGGLCVLALGASVLAVWTVNRPHPSLSQTSPANSVLVSAPTGTAEEPQDGDQAETEVATQEHSPPPSPSEDVARLSDWRSDIVTDSADLLVVGDGYSNLPSQWIQLWGAVLSEDRPVTIRHWGEAADRSFNEPIELSTGDGPSLSIWSASRDGSTIMDAVERLERFDRASADPEAVLISLGQGSADEDIPAAMDELLAGLPEVPVLLVVGPAALYDAGVGDALADWGVNNEDRVVTVDLRETTSGSPTAEEWAQAFQEALDG